MAQRFKHWIETEEKAHAFALKLKQNPNARNIRIDKVKDGWSVSYTNLLMRGTGKSWRI